MNAAAARYVIIRFLPYQDAGEFVNVGIVLIRSQPGQATWLLATGNDTARLEAFFGAMPAEIYRDAARVLAAELDRLVALINGGWLSAQRTLDGLTKARNGVLRYSDPRAIMVEDCGAAAADLFARLVRQDRSAKAALLSGALAGEAPERG